MPASPRCLVPHSAILARGTYVSAWPTRSRTSRRHSIASALGREKICRLFLAMPLERMAFYIITAAILVGCANGVNQTAVQERPDVITLRSGQKVCGVHQVPLITIRGYKPEGIIL